MWDLRLSALLIVGIFSLSGTNGLVITPTGTEHSVFQGDQFFVSCSSDASNVQRVMWTGPEDQQITDYTGSVPHNKIPRIYVEDGRSGHKGVDLVFENITRKDRGTYTCSANVDGKEESVSFELYVFKHIDFDDTPTVQYLEENRDSSLRCDVSGDPKPNIMWLLKARKIRYGSQGGDKYRRDEDNPGVLIVQNATLEDAGEYTCKALQLSERTSNFEHLMIDVKVHHKPRLSIDNMSQAYSYVTGTVNLTCEAIAEPKANFSWVKDDQILMPSDTIQIINYPNKSILQLTVTDQNMFGDYDCIAENHLGTMERAIILGEGSKPAKPTIKVTKAEVNAIHLALDATNPILDAIHLALDATNHPEMPILGFRVQYKTAGDDWNPEHTRTTDFKKGDKYVINRLNDDTLYELRAYAKNAAGLSDHSEEVLGRTDKVKAMNVTSSSSFVMSSFPTLSTLILALLVFL